MKFKHKIGITGSLLFFLIGLLFSIKTFAISIQKEEEMGKEFMKVVFKHYDLIDDPFISDYVNRVGQRIVSVFPNQHFTYRFYVLKEDVYNAFAAPAGHVFINSGLLAAMDSEEELAGILGHEIAHVEARHISQKIERSSKINMLTLAGMAAGIFLGAGGAETAAQALSIGSVAAGQSLSLAYSRQDEMQADQLGLKYIAAAGYNGSGLLAVLKKIRGTEWFGSDQIPTYLKTHPASEDRIAYIGSQLEGKTSEATKSTEFNDFNRAVTILKAVYGQESTAFNQFNADIEKDSDDPLAHYGLGLLYDRKGERKKAEMHMKAALKIRPFDPYILSSLGKIYFLAGRYNEALSVLEDTIEEIPNNTEVLFYLGRTELELGDFQNAALVLEDLVRKRPDFSMAHYFLGEAYGKSDQLGDAHYHLGIHYKQKGSMKTAAFHLEKALKIMTDPSKKENINKMLEEIQKRLRKQQDQKR